VVAQLGDGAFEPEPAWAPLPEGPSAPARSRLLKFGISARELGTVDERRASELVLERVAAVEIMKR
jgi:tRNA threonylcarbamoyladenosine modification (KEOPS) complex Cgi121 subunit